MLRFNGPFKKDRLTGSSRSLISHSSSTESGNLVLDSDVVGARLVDVFARLIRLKPNSRERVKEWANEIASRRGEALETLKQEGVNVESYHLMTLEDVDYLLLYMRSQNLDQAGQTGSESESEIDAIHQQFKIDSWVRGAGCVGQLLLDLELDNRGD